jgi:hypothetical protein
MRIKYKLNTNFRKILSLTILCLSISSGHAQISGGEIRSDEKQKKEKKSLVDEDFNVDSLNGNIFYVSSLIQHSFRSFEDQSVYNQYALLSDETPMIRAGVDVGIIMPLVKKISLSAGLTYFFHGEQYAYDDPTNDSTYQYSRVYSQAGIPLKLRFTHGDNLQVTGYLGLTPLNILNFKYTSQSNSAEGVFVDHGSVVVSEGFTPFNVMASAGIGLNYYINHFGFSLSTEYRRHLMNTYSENTFKRTHFMYGVGLNLGFQWRF